MGKERTSHFLTCPTFKTFSMWSRGEDLNLQLTIPRFKGGFRLPLIDWATPAGLQTVKAASAIAFSKIATTSSCVRSGALFQHTIVPIERSCLSSDAS